MNKAIKYKNEHWPLLATPSKTVSKNWSYPQAFVPMPGHFGINDESTPDYMWRSPFLEKICEHDQILKNNGLKRSLRIFERLLAQKDSESMRYDYSPFVLILTYFLLS